jgi:hypothetical protein
MAGGLSRRYAPLVAMDACLLAVVAAVAAPAALPYGWLLSAWVCGFQNALVTGFSGAVLRATHLTGLMTDVAIVLGQALLGNSKGLWKLLVLAPIWLGYLCGSAAGGAAAQPAALGPRAFVIPAALLGLLAVLLALPPSWRPPLLASLWHRHPQPASPPADANANGKPLHNRSRKLSGAGSRVSMHGPSVRHLRPGGSLILARTPHHAADTTDEARVEGGVGGLSRVRASPPLMATTDNGSAVIQAVRAASATDALSRAGSFIMAPRLQSRGSLIVAPRLLSGSSVIAAARATSAMSVRAATPAGGTPVPATLVSPASHHSIGNVPTRAARGDSVHSIVGLPAPPLPDSDGPAGSGGATTAPPAGVGGEGAGDGIGMANVLAAARVALRLRRWAQRRREGGSSTGALHATDSQAAMRAPPAPPPSDAGGGFADWLGGTDRLGDRVFAVAPPPVQPRVGSPAAGGGLDVTEVDDSGDVEEWDEGGVDELPVSAGELAAMLAVEEALEALRGEGDDDALAEEVELGGGEEEGWQGSGGGSAAAAVLGVESGDGGGAGSYGGAAAPPDAAAVGADAVAVEVGDCSSGSADAPAV